MIFTRTYAFADIFPIVSGRILAERFCLIRNFLSNKKDDMHIQNIHIAFFMLYLYEFLIFVLENSSYSQDCFVMYVSGNFDTGRRRTCMNDAATADINSNVTTVAYNITRLHVGCRYRISDTS